MSGDIDELTPDHAVTLGDGTDHAASGEEGRHDRVSVTLSVSDTHTFRSTVEVEPSPAGDRVIVESVPAHIGVELLGGVVDLNGDVIAEGEYTWTDHDTRQPGENSRRVTFTQLVRCSTCSNALGGGGSKTSVGRVCKKCDRAIGVEREGDQ